MNKKILLWAGAAAAVIGVLALLFFVGKTVKDISPWHEGDWIKGSKDAQVVLTEYADFECPSCAQTHPILEQAKKEFGDKVAIVFRHYPIAELHANALPAAWAAEAAGKQGKFWEMHDLLFSRQNFWKDEKDPQEKFTGYAADVLGLNKEQFVKDYTSNEIQTKVAAARESSQKDGISSTPTIFINGKHVKIFIKTYDELKQLIEQELSK